MRPIRLDDLGASTKRYEYWSRHRWANVWPLHSRYLFGAWGPYRELSAREIDLIIRTVHASEGTLTLAITANWVERDGRLVPYPEKFPEQAECVREWARRGAVSVALHGRTHCVVCHHRPRWIGGNRRWHREQSIPIDLLCLELIAMRTWLGQPVTRLVLPGQIAAPDDPEIVFHDREFVLDWDAAMTRLQEALRC